MILLFSAEKSQASHAQSADITYTCIGGNQYNVRLAFYRDCAGVAAPNSVTINVSSLSCNQNFNVTLNRVPGTGIDVTPICPSVVSQCNGGTYPGVQEWVFQGPMTLPANCDDWVLSFNLCCRNNAISTINNPGGDNIYVEARLDNLNYICNNSPQFSNKPVPFICVNQTYCFNHGAIDPDGDSLVYQLIPPATGPGTTVTYFPGYSATQPMLSNPLVNINSVTGDICMSPTQLDVTVMAVRVLEFRNGEFVGSVIRDIQVRIINCTNTNPFTSGINGTTNYTTSACAGNQISFTTLSNDLDAGQNVTLTWNAAIPGATFTTSAGAHPIGTFTWTPTQAQISSNPYCFTVTVQDDNCPLNGTQTYSFCITVSGFTTNTNSTSANCGASNGTVNVTATGGSAPYQYLWSTGNTNNFINGLAAGTYYIDVTDALGCTISDTAIVAQGTAPGNINMNIIPVSCFGGTNGAATANVNGGQAPYTYLWSNGATTPTITGLTAGTYNLTVTTANGCITTSSAQITQPASALSISTNFTNVTCFGANDGVANAIANGGTAPYVYSWNTIPVQNTPSINNLTSGTYQITVMDGEGCTAIQQVNISSPSAINITQTSTTPVSCYNGNNGSVSVIANGGAGGFQYLWNTFPVQTTATATNLFAGNYSVTVTDINGCTNVFNATVTQPNQLIATITAISNVTCNGLNNGAAVVGVSGGTGPYIYHWNSIPQQYTATANTLDGGTYTASIMDSHGCTATAQAVITEPAPLLFSALGTDTICPGIIAPLIANVSGGTAPYQYIWNNGLGNAATHNVSPAATTNYTVNAIDANGCPTASQNLTITVNNIAMVSFGVIATNQICEGMPATIIAEVAGGIGNYTINWNNGLPNGTGPHTDYPTTSGYYTATITDECGNQRTESAWVEVNLNPQVQLSPLSLTECARVHANFYNDLPNYTGSTYFWDFGDGNSSTQEVADHTFTQSGNYIVTLVVTTAQGCVGSDTTTVSIFVKQQSTANFAMENRELSIFDPTVKLTNQSLNYSTSYWTFGDGNNSTQTHPIYQYLAEGTYLITLVVNNANNCPDTTSEYVIVNPEFTFYLPNAFSPDGDGKNDVFFGKGDNIDEFELLIFNRWGENIFASQNINNAWDGTYKNEPAKPDVYVYKVKIKDSVKGNWHYYDGHVTLVK